MDGTTIPTLLHLDATRMTQDFDVRPFAFHHDLHRSSLLSYDSLLALAQRMAATPADWYVAASAPKPDAAFFSVDHNYVPPHEAMAQLEQRSHRVLLKRPENHDSGFRDLLDQLFAEIIAKRGGLRGAKVVRRETGLFISSGAATTPFHYDPELNFFMQIEGEKEYHIYAPAAVAEPELESFFVRGELEIAQIPLDGRDPSQEHVFELRPGQGHHQPQNAPHWVRTGAGRSISFAVVWETDETRAVARTRACNHYLRRLGMQPQRPGMTPQLDAMKAGVMRVATPMRKAAAYVKHGMLNR